MASEKDLELLDQYISNRLTAQDKTAFEKKLAADNSLKNEFRIQQRIVEKIREARVSELKTMFNSIPATSLETGTAPIAKAALWVAVAGAVGVGAYLFLNDDKAETQNSTSQEQVTKEIPPSIESEPQSTPRQESPADVQKENTPSGTSQPETGASAPSENDSETSTTPPTSDELKSEEESKAPAPIDVFDPTEEADEKRSNANPEAKSSESSPLNKSSIVVETDANNKTYTFHYQFKNGKLYLYGAFEKNLYEIMEFFSDNKRTVFLYYKDSYYLLNEENETVKPLAPINDPTLIKKLKDYRGTR
jgi:cytoskeletal protein RodZ